MVTGENGNGPSVTTQERLQEVAYKLLIFGEFSGKRIGDESFQDPVMHAYFLLYMLGAADALCESDKLDAPLSQEEKIKVMRMALTSFGTASPEQVTSTVNTLDAAADEPALHIRREGREAAQEWRWGENEAATSRFFDLMQDPDNFPRRVEHSQRVD